MKILDFILLFLLFFLLFFGIYLLWLNLPSQTTIFEEYRTNFSYGLPSESVQFYPNMRYPDKKITYSLSQNCNENKKNDFKEAILLLESKTILNFEELENAQIIISCSQLSPTPQQRGYFFAGEGGPTEIINASKFAVIFAGKISLYREETCSTPQIATHELLHALGFNHNNNEESIMFPITKCNQKIDRSIIDDINNLYSIQSAGDLVIESVSANKEGRYLNFEVVIVNIGLKDVTNSTLKVLADNKFVRFFELKEINIGAKKRLGITNLLVPRDVDSITLIAETNEQEISKNNNEAKISSIQKN